MAIAITKGYTFAAGETVTSTKLNLLGVPSITCTQNEILGRATAGTGAIEALTASQVRTILGLATTDTVVFAILNAGTRVKAPYLLANGPIAAYDSASGGLYAAFTGGVSVLRSVADNSGAAASLSVQIGNGTQVGLFTSTGLDSCAIGATTAATLKGTTGEFTDTTDATSTTAAAVKLAGGLAVVKKAYFGDTVNAPVFNVTSARRFKKNIRALKADPRLLLALRPVWYDDRPTKQARLGRKHVPGFIAEELNRQVPSLVHKVKGKIFGVNYQQLVPLLTGALQDHERRLRKLEAC